MKCGSKWGRNHKCPPQIPLQVLEEFLDAMNIEEEFLDAMNIEEEDPEEEEISSEEDVLSLSLVATEGIQGKKTIKLQELIHNQEIILLVDSGSSSTFINTQTVEKLQYQLQDTQRGASYNGQWQYSKEQQTDYWCYLVDTRSYILNHSTCLRYQVL